MTLTTDGSGDHIINYNCYFDSIAGGNNTRIIGFIINNNGTTIAVTERLVTLNRDVNGVVALSHRVNITGGVIVKIQVKIDANTVNVYNRELILIRE